VKHDGTNLSFNVVKTADVTGPVAVAVWADGEALALDATAAASAEQAEESAAGAVAAAEGGIGQLIDLGSEAGASMPVTVAVDSGTTAVVRVLHVVDGAVRSVTEMAIVLPSASGAAGATAAGSADTDADTNGTSASSGASAASDGDVASLPDVAPSLPEMTLSEESDVTVPTLPTDDLPVTVPSPPVTVPSVPENDTPPLSVPLP
jgi:hypothetical protein